MGTSYDRGQIRVAPHAGARIETRSAALTSDSRRVAPHAGARIETYMVSLLVRWERPVAPHAGARIETSREVDALTRPPVAPHAGARIETPMETQPRGNHPVAPHAGARIETFCRWRKSYLAPESRPTRARGLKHNEMRTVRGKAYSRAPRGRAD